MSLRPIVPQCSLQISLVRVFWCWFALCFTSSHYAHPLSQASLHGALFVSHQRPLLFWYETCCLWPSRVDFSVSLITVLFCLHKLQEALYLSFDRLAQKRRIFKVETVRFRLVIQVNILAMIVQWH